MTDPRVSAVEDNLVAQFRLVARSGVVAALPDDDVVAYISDVKFPLFNAITGARFAAGTATARTTELVDAYVDRGLPFLWWATPSHLTPETDAVLRSRGIEPSPEPGMHVPLRGPVDTGVPRDGLEIVETGPSPEVVDVMTAGFGFPDVVADPLLRVFGAFGPDVAFHALARLDGVAVGVGSVFVTGRTAGIYNIATVESARRRGIGYAVTATLMNIARERGCTEAVLMASVMGRPTYERLGFVEVCQTPQYVWNPSR
ncbi:acetyltransferase (GNAT) family protein [Humibacillus xanthopallidus]|uniref:Acetyltransferase (GNAT) family protein n=1 Tax=Humibacillus xanthopallidus TaxID=412689 RepID=A0A543PL68_9MICO|nr:GNAT family N-acetyltransferase [Humibacillus xanthopallidus]TQN44825.1 acetyltransferase (GNAT) family protein [Humibacillus xanthopallidus]